jgi:hypothetical protein
MESIEKKINRLLIWTRGVIITSELFSSASVAQLVERNLAKVDVESSSLFTRSIFCTFTIYPQSLMEHQKSELVTELLLHGSIGWIVGG